MGKFCKKCGTPINDNTNFCPRCGCNQMRYSLIIRHYIPVLDR
ncbi:MAG: zinc-ribbon domain-containing protein [Anaerovibrio sp.]|nr:zinc-ribbon domain-containing protein [Anaerovibrio sp.]